MLHESPNSKPETIEQRKIVFHYVGVGVAWMRVVPLVRAKPTEEESTETEMLAKGQEEIIQHMQKVGPGNIELYRRI